MDREAMNAHRHDRRLAHRRGWISPGDARAAEEALTDAASKSITLGEVADASEGASDDGAPSPPTSLQP